MDAPVTAPPSPPPTALPSLWRNRSFNLLWISQSLSDLGSSMASLAIPLLVLAVTGSPVQAGLVGTVGLAVRLVMRLPAGVLADRLSRRPVMVACEMVRLAAYVVLAVAVVGGWFSIVVVLAVEVVDSALGVLFVTNEFASLRNLVPAEQLPVAVARNEARSYGVSLAGPPLGGLLFGLGRALPFLGNAISYLVSLVGVLLIRTPLQQARDATAPPTTHRSDLVEGIRFVFGNPFLRGVLAVAPPLNFAFNGAVFALVLALQRNGLPPVVIGTAESIFGIGGLVGAFAAGALQQRMRPARLIIGICWAAAGLIALSSLLTTSVAAAVPLAVAVFLAPACNAALFGYQAAITPDHLQGRVMSVIMLVALSITTVAPALAGVIVAHLGGGAAMLVFAAAAAVSAVVGLTSTGIRTMGTPASAATPSAGPLSTSDGPLSSTSDDPKPSTSD